MRTQIETVGLDSILWKPLRHLFHTPKRMLKGYVKRSTTVLNVGCGPGCYRIAMAAMVGP